MNAIDLAAALLRVAVTLLAQSTSDTLATRYDDPGDPLAGGTPACWRRCLRVAPGGSCARKFPDDLFDALHPIRCAHRRLPCGTVLAVVRVDTGAFGLCAVLDRGPYGEAPAVRGDRRTRATGPRRGLPRSVYRGDLDLSPAVAERLGLRRGGADPGELTRKGAGRVPVAFWPVADLPFGHEQTVARYGPVLSLVRALRGADETRRGSAAARPAARHDSGKRPRLGRGGVGHGLVAGG